MKTYLILALIMLFSNLFSQTSFTVDQSEGCGPLTVNYNNTSDLSGGYFIWDFDDGTAPLQDDNGGTHIFLNSGTYSFTLRKYNYQDIEIGIYVMYIKIYGADSISVSTGIDACIGEKVWVSPFDDGNNTNINQLKWYFGEGDTIFNNYTTSHIYNNPGTYNITMYVETQCGIDTVIQQIEITNSATPIVDFYTNSAPEVCINDQIKFTPKYPADSYFWNFDDGTTDTIREPSHIFNLSGNKNVELEVTNICGNTVSKSIIVDVRDNLDANAQFNYDSYSNCPNTPVSFNTYYTGNYSWTFDTVSTSVEQNPNVLFGDTGTYSVQLILTNGCGNKDTSNQIIQISFNENNRPDAYINFDINGPDRDTISICPGEEVLFRNNTYPFQGVDYLWDFGDGQTSVLRAPSHIFDNPGYNAISLVATNQCMGKDTAYLWVNVDNTTMPSGQLGTMPDTICPGENVSFIDFGSESDGEIPNNHNYYIDFGDGSLLTNPTTFSDSTIPVFNHSYANIGTYQYIFSLTNLCGNTVADTGNIYVMNNIDGSDQYLIINSTEDTYGGGETKTCINEPVQFIVIGGSSYEWHFGDGTISIDTNFVTYHSYADTGNYSAYVIISNTCGYVDTVTSSVYISGTYLPQTYFDISGVGNCPNDTLNFKYERDGYLFDSYTYLWEFGDDSIAAGINTYHSYTHGGEYDIKLLVTNGCGTSEQYRHIVIDGPLLSFNVSDDNVLPNEDILFTNTSTNSTSYTWYFGDGLTSNVISPTHSYGAYGYYDISLKGTNSHGCTDSLSWHSFITVSSLQVDAEVSNLTCNQLNDGYIILSIVGGTPPYNVVCDELPTSSYPGYVYSNLIPGTYNFHISDVNNTIVNKTYTITQPQPISFWSEIDTVTCNGMSNGKIVLNVTGGTQPYNYEWSKKDYTGAYETMNINSNPLTNLTYGSYKVTITDANGCEYYYPYVLDVNGNNLQPYIAYGQIDHCGLPNSGNVSAYATNVGRPIFVEWFNGDTATSYDFYSTTIVTPLALCAYSVTITDIATGCVYNENIDIHCDVSTIDIGNYSFNEYVCSGDTTGYIELNVNGGSGSYTYEWSNNVQTYNIADNGRIVYHLPVGIYSVIVTDTSDGCQAVRSFEIKTIAPPTLTYETTLPNCYGDYTGGIKVLAYNELPPNYGNFSYIWSNGAMTDEIINRNSGNYSVTVSDNYGCSSSINITLPDPEQMVITLNQSNVTEYGGHDGVASVIVNNGNFLYIYNWEDSSGSTIDNSQTGNYIDNLQTGNYYVTVTDNNGCEVTANTFIDEPDLINFSITINGDSEFCYGETTQLEVPAGYNSYEWSTGETTANITVGETGTYTVTISDNFQIGIDTVNIVVSHPYNDEKICMVTVDTASLYNKVIWEKTFNVGIVSYNVYKLFGSQYLQIGTQLFDNMSEFIDSSSQPNVHADRYKISVIDTCGNESDLSPYHQTMYMGISDNNLGGNTVIILDWDEAIIDEGAEVIDWYYIYKGNTPTSISQVDSVSGVFTGWNDYNANGALYYRVVFNATHACIPTSVDKGSGGPYSHSLSNLDDYSVGTNIFDIDKDNNIAVYPNPFNTNTTVSFYGSYSKLDFKLVDFTGRTIVEENNLHKSEYLLDGSNLAKGIYFVEFKTDDKVYRKKVVVN